MSDKVINIKFEGYWRDEKKRYVPEDSGVYCVYECKHNVSEKESTVTLLKIIYIGEAENARERISAHERYQDWLRNVNYGNELCFSFGSVGSVDRERAEAAMIYKHKPVENEEYRDDFPYNDTTISLTGKTNLLNTYFTVHRTN